jgi:hypothetical protein
MYAIVNAQGSTPGAAASMVQRGLFMGSALGPLGFGLTMESSGIRAAWLVQACMLAVAAILVMLARRTIIANIAQRT